MELAPILDGFAVVLEPTNLLYCLLGVPFPDDVVAGLVGG